MAKIKTCKVCKNEFEQRSTLQAVCSPRCFNEHKQNKEAARIKPREAAKSAAKELAQMAFNAYIRARDKGRPCISCGAPWTDEHQAGHYVPVSSGNVLRFDEDNCHGQCRRCNMELSGNLAAYRIGLIGRIGHDAVCRLEQDRRVSVRDTEIDFGAIAKMYKDKRKELQG